MPQINSAGRTLIEEFEGCSLTAYPDPGTGGEPYTIGFGHTGSLAAIGLNRSVALGDCITQEQADTLLDTDLERFESGVSLLLDHDATPNQFAAMVSFAYNCGVGAFSGSVLRAQFNAGNMRAAAADFDHWVNGPSGPMPGLVRRRAAEAKLFLTPG